MWDGRRSGLSDGRVPWVARKVADGVRPYIPVPGDCSPFTADTDLVLADIAAELTADADQVCIGADPKLRADNAAFTADTTQFTADQTTYSL